MKRTFLTSLLVLAGGTASLQAQTYTYDPVNQQFVHIYPQASAGTIVTSGYFQGQPGYYQSQPTSVVQAAAQQFLPQYFGNSTSYYYPSSSYGYGNNGYTNYGYGSGYGGYNNGYYSPYSNSGTYGGGYRSNGRGRRR